ncbi:hypothetical protein DKP78_21075, partial [Enterococcus faecium]
DKEGFFKRLLSKEKENEEEEGDRDGFLRRLLRDSKAEDMELTPSSECLLKRLFRDEERVGKSLEDYDKEGFFRKIFKDKNEERKDE